MAIGRKVIPKSDLKSKTCAECGSERLIIDYESAEAVCENCGLVITEKIPDKGPEWRAFDFEQQEKRKRVGGPVTFTMHDKGLSTLICWRNQDIYGRSLPQKQRAQFHRMRKWQRRVRISDSMERNLSNALFTISKICASMRLPKNVFETAGVLYRRALKKGMIRGRSIQGIAAASVYMSCRKCGVARTIDEFAYKTDMVRKDFGRFYRILVKGLKEYIPPSGSLHYISRFSNHLELRKGSETIALRMINAAKKARLTDGKGPLSIAAAVMYIVSVLGSDRRTQREIAEVVGVTEVTVRNRYKDFLENLEIRVKI